MGRPPAERALPSARWRTRSQRTLSREAARSGALRRLQERLRSALGSGAGLLLILDFDGTLVPIVRRPEAARLDPAVRETLRRLAAEPRVGLAVLSGRSLPDIRSRVAVRGIIYGGCHGLEIAGPGLRFSHPRARSLRPRIRMAAAALEDVAARYPGAHVERKGLAVAIHYRGVSGPGLPPLRRRVKQVAARAGLTILPGKKVWDLLPPGHRGKGKAVGILRTHLEKRLGVRSSLTVYAGDDAADAEAFRSLGARGFAIQVGGRRGPADYRLPGVREVHALLGWLAKSVASASG